MKRSNRLVILVGVLLAVLAFVAIVILLNNTPDGADTPEETTETVLVAIEPIEIGDPVTPDLVEEQQIDPRAIQGTALRSVTQVSGQPALFPVPAGSQVSAEAIGLGSATSICIACQLSPGEKAITFQVDRLTGADFLVRPGDTIDLVISQTVPAVQETADSAANTDPEAEARFEPVTGLENLRSVKAILQDKRVLYVSATKATEPELVDTNNDGVIDSEDQQPAEAVIDGDVVFIVFAGSEQDAEVVKFAQGQEFAISAIIRHADDDAIEDTLGITLRQLVDEFGLVIPNIIQLEVETAE